MAHAKHTDSVSGPWTNMSSLYCGQMDSALKAADPMLRAVGRVQLEWMHLGMQRGRAWASLPAELSRCKSPVDLAAMQMRFLQAMGLNYAEATYRIWHAAAALSMTPPLDGRGASRDVIEVRGEADHGEPRTRDRQAA
ncbi:MAG: hypothetical protein NW223_15795 [Hyphomicrobiaceae bacterium]|nr:hypothetical protein [Hyphomicrobiaceae bacterium]